MSAIPTIVPAELNRRRQAGESVELIDVRTPAEFREVHAVGAENIPLDELHGAKLQELAARGAQRSLFTICQSGTRSAKAASLLASAGASVTNIDGGTRAWDDAGLPVERGKKTISLERQVRIAAGSLALAGALLAVFVHPAFVWLSAFIGGGLLFAGLTDTCGMGMLLAKMPWNRS